MRYVYPLNQQVLEQFGRQLGANRFEIVIVRGFRGIVSV